MRWLLAAILGLGACRGTLGDGDAKGGTWQTTPADLDPTTPRDLPSDTGSGMTVFDVDWVVEPALLDDPDPSAHSHFTQATALDGGGAAVLAGLDFPAELAVYAFDAVGTMSAWRAPARNAAVDGHGLLTDRDAVEPGLLGSEDASGPDPRFGADGTIQTGLDAIHSVLVAGDRILVGSDGGSLAFDRDGVPDPTWGVDGWAEVAVRYGDRLFPDGRVGRVSGTTATLYDARGDRVATVEDVPVLRSVEPGPHGGWIVVGDAVHALLADGQPDRSFAEDGVWTPGDGVATTAVARADGGFLVGIADEITGVAGVSAGALVCLSATGQPDPCLRAEDGSRESSWTVHSPDTPGLPAYVFHASVAPDGEHVVLGGYGGETVYNLVMQLSVTTE